MHSIVLVTILLNFFIQSSQVQSQVATSNGPVVGSMSEYDVDGSDMAVIEYLGIPYAAALTGSNRFKPPSPVQNWTEPFLADSYGPSCPQDVDQLDDMLEDVTTTYLDFRGQPEVDEDCLYLNIYQPNTTNDGLAVMVYFHGGDFVSGTGMAYAGNVLSSTHEVIVVTVNYRLGAFGFLSDGSEEFPGNYGLLDQQKALQWIKENIINFGGDPDQITIFGSGAGASSVHLHTIISESSQYFRRAIVQSASYNDGVWKKDTAAQQYENLLSELGISGDSENVAEHLRDLDWKDIQEALPGPWRPVINENLIPDEPRLAMVAESDTEGKDILVGSNNLDAYQIVVSDVNVAEPDWYRDAIRDITNETSEFSDWSEVNIDRRMLMFNQYYVGFGTDIEFFPPTLQNTMISRMYSDQIYGTWAHEIAMASFQCSCNMYKYMFKRRASDGVAREPWALQMAARGDELTFVFGFITKPLSGVSNEDRILSRQMMEIWTEFAKTGKLQFNSSEGSLNEFSAFSSSDSCRSTIYLDAPLPGEETGITEEDDLPVARNWEFWKRYYVTLGFSCSEEKSGETTYSGDEDVQDECEAGVWSDAGVVMTNETAGALLITFIVLTGFFMLAFLCSCHKLNKAKRKVRKVLDDGGSSVISNSSTRM